MSAAPRLRRQAGFTVTELMVAAVIGLILLGGAMSMLVTTRQTYQIQNDLARIQENARFGMDLMLRDLRMAGYFGCHDNLGNVTNHLNGATTAGTIYDTTRGIEGLEDGAGAWAPSNNIDDEVITSLGGAVAGDAIAGSDAVTVRRAGGVNWQVQDGTSMATTSDPPVIIHESVNGVTLAAGDIVAVSDCTSADIFQITNTPAISANDTDGKNVEHAAGGGDDAENAAADFSKRYDDTSIVSPVQLVRYYVGRTVDGAGTADPALYRLMVINGAIQRQRLVDGVESLQITYGIDTTGDDLPDTYVAANDGALGMDANNWNNVVAVRVGMLLRSAEETGSDVDTRTYTLNGQELFGGDPPNDLRRRRSITSTVFLRNDPQ